MGTRSQVNHKDDCTLKLLRKLALRVYNEASVGDKLEFAALQITAQKS